MRPQAKQIQAGKAPPSTRLNGAFFVFTAEAFRISFQVFRIDDWVILAPTRWKLRRAIRAVNQTLAALKLDQHPDKTFIGRTRRGFDFLGYQFSPAGLGVAAKTLDHFAERMTRLYEHGADAIRIGTYVWHWR